MRRLLAILLIAILPIPAAAMETCRVDVSNGAPRILVDGKPVRARMFWGGPGFRPINIDPAGREISFEFEPVLDEPGKATMHFRFGQSPGEVCLDNIRVVEVETGRDVIAAVDFEDGGAEWRKSWVVWPPAEKNNVGKLDVASGAGREGTAGLKVSLSEPAKGPWPDFHIFHHANLALRKGKHYRVTLWAKADKARDLTIAFYRPGETFVCLGGPPDVFAPQIKMAAAAGAPFVSFPCDLPWPKPGQEADFSIADAQCRYVLAANPNALLVPRIGMDPPAWWYAAHPDDAMQWDSGPPPIGGVVVASPEYRRDAAARLSALVEHLEAKFGESVAGYHPCGQNTGEWFYQNSWDQPLSGYARGDLTAWQAWLKDRYKDDAAIQAAWRDPVASFAKAEVPASALRRGASNGVFRDPVAERKLIDFAEFQQNAMADCVCCLAKAAREASKGRKLVLFFYGYVFEFAALQNSPSVSGHYALRKALRCGDIDILCSPISYFDRGLGQSAPAMTAAESVALAGKMWLYEDDTRTYLGTGSFPGAADAVSTLEDSNRELVRNTAQCAVRNFGTWWMDLGTTGWFQDPQMWAEMKRLEAIDLPLLESPQPFRPEVAAVVDEASMLCMATGSSAAARPSIYEARRPLGRMGAPYGQYLLDDVLAGRVSAKVYVFLSAFRLNAPQRKKLLGATHGSVRIWCYAPGYLDDAGFSLDTMRELTGFTVKRAAKETMRAEPTEAGRRLGLQEAFGANQPMDPLFTVEATDAETLAAYRDGSPAAAIRQTADGTSLFVGTPALSSELLRAAARKAGAHLTTQTDCNVYANGPFLVLHASHAGPIEIDVGRDCEVIDLLAGRTAGRGPTFTLTMAKGDTRVLQCLPGAAQSIAVPAGHRQEH